MQYQMIELQPAVQALQLQHSEVLRMTKVVRQEVHAFEADAGIGAMHWHCLAADHKMV